MGALDPYPKARLRTHTLRPLGPKTILYKDFWAILSLRVRNPAERAKVQPAPHLALRINEDAAASRLQHELRLEARVSGVWGVRVRGFLVKSLGVWAL